MSASSPNVSANSAVGKYTVIGDWTAVSAATTNRSLGDTALVTGLSNPLEVIWDGVKWSTPGYIKMGSLSPSLPDSRIQPHLGTKHTAAWMPNGAGATTATQWGGVWATPPMLAVAMADTTTGRIRKAMITSGASAGGVVGIGSAAAYSRNSGFHLIGHFCPFASGNPVSRRFFAGIGTGVVANAAMTGYLGMGVHSDASQTTLQVRGMNGVATNLGANFPTNVATAWYRLELFCKPLGADVAWSITNTITGATASGVFTGAQVPGAATFMAVQCRIVTTASVAQMFHIGNWTVETDF